MFPFPNLKQWGWANKEQGMDEWNDETHTVSVIVLNASARLSFIKKATPRAVNWVVINYYHAVRPSSLDSAGTVNLSTDDVQ